MPPRYRIRALGLPGLLLLDLPRHRDARGFLSEWATPGLLAEAGIPTPFAQTNRVRSLRGVVRGLHYQLPPAAPGKLIGVIQGRIRDVALDLRPDSATFGRHEEVELSGRADRLLWIPAGFAHGYATLSRQADLIYQLTAPWDPALERGIHPLDPALDIDWGVAAPLLSAKDQALPPLRPAGHFPF